MKKVDVLKLYKFLVLITRLNLVDLKEVLRLDLATYLNSLWLAIYRKTFYQSFIKSSLDIFDRHKLVFHKKVGLAEIVKRF